MRLYKIIKDLSISNIKSQDTFTDYVDNSIFLKNFVKIFQVVARKQFDSSITNKIENSGTFYLIKSNLINPFSNSYSSKYVIVKNINLLNSHTLKIEFSLSLHKNNMIVEFKNPLKNTIYICERETFNEEVYERFDIKYLLKTLENLLENNNN